MNYFMDSKLIPKLYQIKDDSFGLREAQLGAFWAICSHFTASDEAALVFDVSKIWTTHDIF